MLIVQISCTCTETLFLLKWGGVVKIKSHQSNHAEACLHFSKIQNQLISEIKLKLCTGSKQDMRFHAEDFPNYAKL